MDLYTLCEIAQLRAIHSAIDPSSESIYRLKCRQYSIMFHTPLHIVLDELDPLQVLTALYEEQYHPSIVEEECEELLDKLYTMKDPTYSRMSKEETEALVDAVINKEIERAKKKKRPTQETIQKDIKVAETTLPQKPKSGSMSFGSLEKLEAQSEANKAGFDDQ